MTGERENDARESLERHWLERETLTRICGGGIKIRGKQKKEGTDKKKRGQIKVDF